MSKISLYAELAEAPANDDEFVIVDKSDTTMSASGTTKKIQSQYVTIADATDSTKGKAVLAGGQIHAATEKTTPVDADELGLVDSAASNVLKKLTWANLKATLKTYLTSEAFSFVTGVKDFASGILTATSPVLTTPKVVTSINDSSGNEVIKTPATASAVNEITVTNAATGGIPDISPTGDDTNISLSLQGKGTGKVEVELPYGSASVTSTSTTSTSFSDVTGASFSFTIKKTSHVKITFNGYIQNNSAVNYMNLQILRDATSVLNRSCHVAQSGIACNTTLVCVDESLAAGTYTIKLQLAAGTAGQNCNVLSGKLFAEAIIA